MYRFLCAVAALFTALHTSAGNIDDIRQVLEQRSGALVQEKVYVHTDNQCYFVGDTLWFKAYVVRADNLQPTDMSRVLYVELLSPDGLLVERQQIIVSPKGYTCGQFCLTDSLYSGYYELRAYTRWMLNFNMRHHRYRRQETWAFYNSQMAADYYRIWDGLYSRVFPVYSKPDAPGDYDARRMYQRPHQRLPRQKKDELTVTFFPEGGHLVEGVENRVAFQLTDQNGEAVNLKGTLLDDGQAGAELKTEYMGRGTFSVTPTARRLKARFNFKGKAYDVSLPKSEDQGVALRFDGRRLTIATHNLPAGNEYGLSVLCRGALRHFQALPDIATDGTVTVELPTDQLPTGVNDVTLFDADGRIWADRLFFVNHHEHDDNVITSPLVANHTYQPFERVEVPISCAGVTQPVNISVSIRDTNTDEPTYDNGNIMTDMLLSSELRGFIARPAYYFEADDPTHGRHLDLLMMVQGWRKYKWSELADSQHRVRYAPETMLTVEGSVYKMPSITPVEADEIDSWAKNKGLSGWDDDAELDTSDPWADVANEDGDLISTDEGISLNEGADIDAASGINLSDLSSANDHIGVNHSTIKREVLVEAELILGNEIASSTQKTTGGRFLIQIPPYYGSAILNMKAYKESDSIAKNMLSRKDRESHNEDAFPDFYVKRDLFYPMFTADYDYYQNHMPDYDAEMLIDTLSDLSMENDVHQLAGVNVKGHRRGKRAIDWNKPAFVMDAYDLYNDITDRGLSWGKLDMRQFPVQVCRYLYGYMNRYNMYNIDGRLDRYTYYRNYEPDPGDAGKQWANRNANAMYKDLKLKRLQDIRVFSDYEPRKEDSLMVQDRYNADATVELVPIPDDGVRPSYRDRHIIFHGFNEAEAFYQPDYSDARPTDAADYRRTLYWNPNAVTDEQGRFTAVFYNNAKETRVRMTAAGVTQDGRLLRSR